MDGTLLACFILGVPLIEAEKDLEVVEQILCYARLLGYLTPSTKS